MTKTITIKDKTVSMDSMRKLEQAFAIKGIKLIFNIVIR